MMQGRDQPFDGGQANMSKTTAVYVRVSSKTQDAASQLPDLERWVATSGAEVKWYRDKFTGKTMARPAFDRLYRDFKEGKIGRVVIWRLDRLGRTASGLTKLFDELVEANVSLVSLRDGLDLSTPAGKLMANVLASVAAYETEVRAERTLAGLEVAKARGIKLGRKVVGQGNGKRIKVEPEQIDLARRLKAEGQTVAAIARATSLSRPTVYQILGQ